MVEEAGGRRSLEQQLDDWTMEERVKRLGRGTASREQQWAIADDLALSLLRKA